MAAGEKLTKWTWMLDNVEVRGIVRIAVNFRRFVEDAGIDGDPAPDGTPVGAGDGFDLELDANYRHIVSSSRGNNPLFSYLEVPIGCIHVEAYAHGITDNPDQINRVEPFPLPDKPGEDFMVLDPDTGALAPLKTGDHVRLVGRWLVENQHENFCWTRKRGLLKVGCVWMELHPFIWRSDMPDAIRLVKPLPAAAAAQEIISVAAPIYEETYARGGLWTWGAGVRGKVFIDDDGSNFHKSVTANAHIQAPPLSAGFTAHASLVGYTEEVLLIEIGLDVAQVRSVTVVDDGIQVAATVQGESIHGPANNKSIFQARYSVRWLPRLVASGNIDVGSQAAGSTTPFSCVITNRGPDPVQINNVAVETNPDSVFAIDPATAVLQPSEILTLQGRFMPIKEGRFSGILAIYSNDPAHGRLEVQLTGVTTNAPALPSGMLGIRVEPSQVPLGRPVQITVFAEDTGSHAPVAGTVHIVSFSQNGQPINSEHPTNTPFSITLRGQHILNHETHPPHWESGEDPGGTVKAPGYADAPIGFGF